MSTPSPSFSHRQSIKIALQYAGSDVWTCSRPQAAPCLLQVDVMGDDVNLSAVGFVPRSGDRCFLHAVPAAEVAKVIEQFGEERMDGETADSYATEEEAQELWARLCVAFESRQAALAAAFAQLTRGAA